MDFEQIIDALVESTKQTIANEVAKVREEFSASHKKFVESVDGKIDAVSKGIESSIQALVTEKFSKVESPKDGADATPEMVARAVADHLAAHPIPQPEPLAPTDAQLDAAVAKHFEGFTVEVPPPDPAMIAKAVADHLQAHPVPVPDAPAPLAPTDEQVARVVAKHLTDNPPEPGARGLDAIELNILPSINPQRRYAKGTYAHHDGGILRATRDTDPGDPLQSGWDVVLRGVSAIEVHPLGGAEFAIKSVLTGGGSHVTKMAAPTFAESYRDVWRESAGEYQRGDMVTHKGSVWLAKQATTERPGTGDGWKLIVKAGRDGKDLNVIKMDRPEVYKLGAQS